MKERLSGTVSTAAAAVLLAGLACPRPADPQVPARTATVEVRPELAHHFQRYGAEGTFVLYDQEEDRWIRFDPDRAARRYIPASTFKIFNALVALETGVIQDEDTLIPWDGVDRGSRAWDPDFPVREAREAIARGILRELEVLPGSAAR